MGQPLADDARPLDPELDRVLSAVSHGVRRAIIERLRHGPATAGQLAAPHSMSLPAISRHLRVLEEARLLTRRIEGRMHYFELAPDTLRPVDDWLAQYRSFWTATLDSLAGYLEENAGANARRRSRGRRSGRVK